MQKQLMLCTLALCAACASASQDETRDDSANPVQGEPDDDPGDGDGDGDETDSPDDRDDDASAPPTHASDAGTHEQDATSGPPPVDADDPPVATAACASDLDVHNGTVRPDFGAAHSAPAFAGDPLDDGPYGVIVSDHTLPNPDPARASFKVTTYAPSEGGSMLEGPRPLLVLLPGFMYKHTDYPHFTQHFASHGLFVLGITPAEIGIASAPDNPANVAEIEAALDWALGESALAGKIDPRKIGATGHSQGGKLAFYAASTDARYKLVIGWDPQNGGGPPCNLAPLLGQDCNAWPVAPACDPARDVADPGMLANLRAETLVFAARDTQLTNEKHMWAEHFYRGAPSPATLVLFPKGKHLDWTSNGAVTQVTKRVQLALVLTRFGLASRLERYLPGGEYAAGESALELHQK
jgi:dienelactone hydrolase